MSDKLHIEITIPGGTTLRARCDISEGVHIARKLKEIIHVLTEETTTTQDKND